MASGRRKEEQPRPNRLRLSRRDSCALRPDNTRLTRPPACSTILGKKILNEYIAIGVYSAVSLP